MIANHGQEVPRMRLRATSLAVALTAAGFAVAGSLSVAAPASATTWNHKWSYLHFPARPHAGEPNPSRTLTLNGTYRWRAFSAHWAHTDYPRATSRTVRLHGRYRWTDDLRQAAIEGDYIHVSTIRNLRTGGKVLLHYIENGRYGDGRYHWGSTLDNVRAR
jgi:hypothetical protein